MPIAVPLLFLPFDSVPECPKCEYEMAFLDSLMVIEPKQGKANQHYFTCFNEDCEVCYHVFTRFDDEDAPLFHGCYSGAYPNIIDPKTPEKGMNHG